MFLHVVPCSLAAIFYSKCQFLSDSSRVHIALILTIMDLEEGKIKAIFLTEFASVHQNDSFSN